MIHYLASTHDPQIPNILNVNASYEQWISYLMYIKPPPSDDNDGNMNKHGI